MVIFIKFLLLACQSEEEASSAGEQLVSNKIDGYTANEGGSYCFHLFICGHPKWLRKNSKPQAFHMQKP